jgi:hypothetical protein
MAFSWRTKAVNLAALIALAAGCSQESRGYLEGVVSLNGAPVGPGTIMLEPVDASRAGAMATFGEDGKYSIISAGRKPGAATGEYRVSILGGEGFGEETSGRRPQSKIPPRYGQADTSNLIVKIEAGNNTQDFDLQP